MILGIVKGTVVATRKMPELVGDKCALDFHIDTDDGNAFLLKQGQLVTVLGKEE